MITYSNPRLRAVFENWPWGHNLKTVATFDIETSTKGERAIRTLIDPKTNRLAAPKKLTFSRKQRIVDGDDGKTYIACLTMYGHITIFQSNMQYSLESVFERDERYPALKALFEVTP